MFFDSKASIRLFIGCPIAAMVGTALGSLVASGAGIESTFLLGMVSGLLVMGLYLALITYVLEPHENKQGRELGDPFAVEVLYKGEVVADLTDRDFAEMYWRDYLIEPRSLEAKEIINNDDLWDESAFDFRDPVSDDICTSAFVGGNRPFIRDGKISLRALYFGRTVRKTEQGGHAKTDPQA